MRSDPGRWTALAAALMTSAPAFGVPARGATWMPVCTGSGSAMQLVPEGGGKGEAAAVCHTACTLTRRARFRR